MRQRPEQQRNYQDDCAGLFHENFRAVERVQERGAQAGQTIRRQFNHQRLAAAGQNGALKNPRHAQRGGDSCDIGAGENKRGLERRLREQQRRDHRIDRDARRARHQRRDEDGRQAVARIFHDARGHDGGNGAGMGGEQRHEGFAGQAELAHNFVHHERGAR